MSDFWKALVEGLTPESPDDAQIWWKIPLFIIVGGLLWSVIVSS